LLSQSFIEGFEKQALWKELALAGSLAATPVAKASSSNFNKALLNKTTYSAGKSSYKNIKASRKAMSAAEKAKDPNKFYPGHGGEAPTPAKTINENIHDKYHDYKNLEHAHGFKIRPNQVSKNFGDAHISSNLKMKDLGVGYKGFNAKFDNKGKVKSIGANVTDNLRVEANPQSKGVSAMWSTSF